MRDLFLQNPMLIEVKRFWRKFFGVSKTNTGNFVVAMIVALAYVLLLVLAVKFRSGPDAGQFLSIETFLFCLIVPSMVHGAIAGERERRTWDLLAVAPISKAQIVIGKFMSAAISILIIAILLLIPALIMDNRDLTKRGGSIFAGQVIALGYAYMLAGLSMLISSFSKRSFSAQAGIYGLQVFGLIIWPILAAVLTQQSFSPARMDFVMYLHPFYAQSRVFQSGVFGTQQSSFSGWSHLIIYLFLAALFLFWAIRRLQLESGQDQLG
jgi:ABC-type transport system involved in multi-copper enzyme maturation permease subunit